jgi:hypothetical protein
MVMVKAVELSTATVRGQGDSIPVASYHDLGMRMGFHCVCQVLVASDSTRSPFSMGRF